MYIAVRRDLRLGTSQVPDLNLSYPASRSLHLLPRFIHPLLLCPFWIKLRLFGRTLGCTSRSRLRAAHSRARTYIVIHTGGHGEDYHPCMQIISFPIKIAYPFLEFFKTDFYRGVQPRPQEKNKSK